MTGNSHYNEMVERATVARQQQLGIPPRPSAPAAAPAPAQQPAGPAPEGSANVPAADAGAPAETVEKGPESPVEGVVDAAMPGGQAEPEPPAEGTQEPAEPVPAGSGEEAASDERQDDGEGSGEAVPAGSDAPEGIPELRDEAGSDNEDFSSGPQEDFGGGEEDKAPAKKTGRSRGRPSKSAGMSETIQINGFPRSLMQLVRTVFPMATNNADALAAFCHVKLGYAGKVSPGVADLARHYSGDKSNEKTAGELRQMNRLLIELRTLIASTELGVAYLAYQRTGYEDKDGVANRPDDPRNFEFLRGRMDQLRARMREEATMQLQHDRVVQARAIAAQGRKDA